VDLIDKRGEDWKEPPKVFNAFSGSGQALGRTSNTPTPASTPSNTNSQATISIKIDDSQPTTSIQIRLANGERLQAKFNLTHTVKDIRAFIDGNKPSNIKYQLMTSYPQKVFTEENQSIQEAGLAGSVLIQKKC